MCAAFPEPLLCASTNTVKFKPHSNPKVEVISISQMNLGKYSQYAQSNRVGVRIWLHSKISPLH